MKIPVKEGTSPLTVELSRTAISILDRINHNTGQSRAFIVNAMIIASFDIDEFPAEKDPDCEPLPALRRDAEGIRARARRALV